MLRPSIIALSLVIAVSLTGCSNAYRRMYSPQRSYYRPMKEESKAADVLPSLPLPPSPTGGATPPPPGGAIAPTTTAPAVPGL